MGRLFVLMCLCGTAPAHAAPPADRFTTPILPGTVRRCQTYAFVNANEVEGIELVQLRHSAPNTTGAGRVF